MSATAPLYYRTGEPARVGDHVRHYVDGDTGTVTELKDDCITVDWKKDGPNDHFADEVSLTTSREF